MRGAGRGILRWIRSFGSFGVIVGTVGAFKFLLEQEWGLVLLGIVFALLSYSWFCLFDHILGEQHEKK